jgi:hypothetical protein
MENKIKRSKLFISLLLLAAPLAAGFGAALLTTTMQPITAKASVPPTDVMQTNKNTTTSYDSITLAEKPFLIEHGTTTVATPINQTHIQISLAGNGTIMLPNSTETVKTKDTGNAIIRLTPIGDIAQGQIDISTEEDASENGTVFFTEIGQNGKGIGVAYFATNSTGNLAFLDNRVAVFQDELQPNGNTVITAWEWTGKE